MKLKSILNERYKLLEMINIATTNWVHIHHDTMPISCYMVGDHVTVIVDGKEFLIDYWIRKSTNREFVLSKFFKDYKRHLKVA